MSARDFPNAASSLAFARAKGIVCAPLSKRLATTCRSHFVPSAASHEVAKARAASTTGFPAR
jgi:hypothetical protein